MNRHQRKAEAAKARAAALRHAAVNDALAFIADCRDPTVTGATLMLPDGEVLHLSADTARAMAADQLDDTAGWRA